MNDDHDIKISDKDMEVLFDISNLLNTGLDKETLSICAQLIEQGVNPEALAAVIRELRREGKAASSVDVNNEL